MCSAPLKAVLRADGTDNIPVRYQQSYKLDNTAVNAGFVNLTSLRLNPHARFRSGGGCRMFLVLPYTLQSLQHLTTAASGGTRYLLCYFLYCRVLCGKVLCGKVCRSQSRLVMYANCLMQCRTLSTVEGMPVVGAGRCGASCWQS